MKIVLRVDGKDKTYTEDFVKGIVFRKALELNKKVREAEFYDEFVEFLAFAFGNQFTAEEAWDGLSVTQIQTEPTRIFNEVLGLGGLVTQPVEGDEEGNETGK